MDPDHLTALSHPGNTRVSSTVVTLSQAGIQSIPGIPEQAQQRLIQLLIAQTELEAVLMFGSRAMGRYRRGRC